MKILVTGGAGFIGSALSLRLSNEGHEVIVLDNFNDYYDVSLKRARQRSLLKGVTVLEGDITDEKFLNEIFTKYQFEVVCHLAAQAGVRYSVENPSVYIDTNVRGTQLLLETMRQHNVMRMIFASSSSVYGNTTQVPFSENAPADLPVSLYAATKRAGELLAHTYVSLYGMHITCLRFFTVYGPWGRPDMALFKFSELIQKGKPIDVYNEGKLQRDFTYIDDIVDGFNSAIERPHGYEIINLGNGSPVALLDFIQLLEKEFGVTAQKNMFPMQEGDVFETYANTNKANALLGYEPKVTLEEGVRRFVSWYKEYQKMVDEQ